MTSLGFSHQFNKQLMFMSYLSGNKLDVDSVAKLYQNLIFPQ